MPRDVNGNYSLPAGNPVTSGTVIESNWANALTSDLAAEMTDSLSRSGKGGFTASVGIIDGVSGGLPGLSFINEPTSGLLRTATGDIRLASLGVDKLRIRGGDTNIAQVWVSATKGWQDIATADSLGVPVGAKALPGVGGTTKIWFYSAIPIGWTAAPPDGNIRALLVGTSVGTGGSESPTGFSETVNISISGTTNSVSVPHGHNLSGVTVAETETAGPGVTIGPYPVAALNHTHPEGSVVGPLGDSGIQTQHSHTYSGSDSDTVSYTPRYARGLIGVLDA